VGVFNFHINVFDQNGDSMKTIVGKKAGREDYSSDVFIQPIPQIRGPLSTTIYRKEFTNVGPGQSVTVDEIFSPSHWVFLVDVSASANIYFEFAWIIDGVEMGFTGWGRINIPLPASHPFSDFHLKITNRSDIPVDFIYCHYALLGVEKITRLTVAPPG
jgi:hypothetical protein